MRQKDPELMKRILEYVTEYYLNYSSTPSTTQIATEVGIAVDAPLKQHILDSVACHQIALYTVFILQKEKVSEHLPGQLRTLRPGKNHVYYNRVFACSQ